MTPDWIAPKRTALLLIDFQVDFASPDGAMGVRGADLDDVPAALAQVREAGAPFKPMDTSYFLARQTLIPSSRPGMWIWREQLFSWMVRNAASAMEFFKLPTNRVIELGSQLEI